MLKQEERLLEVLEKEGIVSIVTTGVSGAHLVATWNSYLLVVDDETVLIPAGGYQTTEANVEAGSKVQLLLGSKEVAGKNGMGTGFRLLAKGQFVSVGGNFEAIKEKFPWARAAFELKIEQVECLM